MRNETRVLFNSYMAAIAQLNGIPDATVKFAVDPTVQQKLESRIMESTGFLSAISIVGVNELKGQKVGIGVTGPIASRTDTSGAGERNPRDVKDLTPQDYEAKQTNYDTAIRYATLDAWAKFPDFQTKLRDAIVRQQGLDRIMIGFNGTSAAGNTNLVANPLLQDVNIGWLEHIRAESPARYVSRGASEAGKVKIGSAGDWKNLDALVYEMRNSLLEPWYRNHPDLRVIIGSDLNTDNVLPQLESESAPTEREALARLLNQSKIGGIPSMQAPYMKAGSILITIPKNLAIYYQEGGRRRTIVDNAKKDRIENYESSNDAYVVEDFGAATLIDNVLFV
jgi:P2 family phage major capsid protein